MKKGLIYQLAIFYQNKIANTELPLSDTRYFRDTFKEVLELGGTIEKDRKSINDKEGENDEKIAELNKLFDEEYSTTLTLDLSRIENTGIKVTANELTLLEQLTPLEVKEVAL